MSDSNDSSTPHDAKANSDSGKPSVVQLDVVDSPADSPHVPYKLYKWRFVGLLGLVLLNINGGLNALWFGPISNATAKDFDITLTQVNWIGNAVQLIFIPMSIIAPYLNKKLGMRNTCLFGAVMQILGAWLRVAATPHSLSPQAAYALFLLGSIVVGISQPIFQALAPFYSEHWFDLRGRTTATMIVAIANPFGGAIGQIVAPISATPRQSMLILAIATTVLAFASLIIKSKPPTPPTFAGSISPLGPMTTVRSMLNRSKPGEYAIAAREKFDFIILTIGFGIYVAATVTFSLLSNQILGPEGYSQNTAGFMGAALLLSGLLSAILTAPLFDRVLTHHLALAIKILTPVLGLAWFSLIWAVRPDNTAALYVVLVIIGISSLTLLPVTLELASEVTRNSDTSAAFLWGSGNVVGFIFVLVQNALRASPDASPPLNMHRSVIFNGVIILVWTGFIQLLRGQQSRRQLDEQMNERATHRA